MIVGLHLALKTKLIHTSYVSFTVAVEGFKFIIIVLHLTQICPTIIPALFSWHIGFTHRYSQYTYILRNCNKVDRHLSGLIYFDLNSS